MEAVKGGTVEILQWINTALLPIVGMLLKLMIDTRKESRGANEAANEAKIGAEKAVSNTQNVSNGFAGTVLRDLHDIRKDQQKLSAQLADHFQWHHEKGE